MERVHIIVSIFILLVNKNIDMIIILKYIKPGLVPLRIIVRNKTALFTTAIRTTGNQQLGYFIANLNTIEKKREPLSKRTNQLIQLN